MVSGYGVTVSVTDITDIVRQ